METSHHNVLSVVLVLASCVEDDILGLVQLRTPLHKLAMPGTMRQHTRAPLELQTCTSDRNEQMFYSAA